MPQRVELADKYGVAIDAANPLPVTGEIAIDSTGLATEAKQDDIITALGEVSIDTTGLATSAAQALALTELEGINDAVNSGAVAPVRVVSAEYETVIASQADQMMGPTGAIGDTIEGILVIPATTSPGAISIEDGATNTTVFTGGTVSDIKPFFIPLLSIASVSGGWEVTTGANVSCIVFGNFT